MKALHGVLQKQALKQRFVCMSYVKAGFLRRQLQEEGDKMMGMRKKPGRGMT